MRWRRSPGDSSGIEDVRGSGGGGGFGRMPGGKIGGGIGGAGLIGIIVAILVVFLGGGGNRAFDIGQGGLDQFPAAAEPTGNVVDDGPDQTKEFVAFVVNDVQNSWVVLFERAGKQYEPTRLRLFTGGVSTGCGQASSATGPFYCPADRYVYLDLNFFRELERRFGAPGDFAQAYVIAHEFGHHVQNLLGIMDQVQAAQQRDPRNANALSVRLELQADCFAGVWAHSAYENNLLEEGDLEEGLTAAAAVGDDRLAQQAGARVDRETFTHGSSQERRDWFLKGFQEGMVESCDTFA